MEQFSISRNNQLYEAWPDLTLTPDGRLLCVFSECSHHLDRKYTRIVLTESHDLGRTWSPKRPLTEGTAELPYYYNCARIVTLSDGRIAITVDRIPREKPDENGGEVLIYWSSDNGQTWSESQNTGKRGIVPGRLVELDDGRLLLSAHRRDGQCLTQYVYHSSDGGASWGREITVARDPRFQFCEGAFLPMGDGIVAAFLREDSRTGEDCKKTISRDNGETWGPVSDFPIPCCHRPSAGRLRNGAILITCRMFQGGKWQWGAGMQNLIGALTDAKSVLADDRKDCIARIFPIDYDRSFLADTGYSGWVELPSGEIYVVNYIVDDNIYKAQIRGYLLRENDIILKGNAS